MKFGAIVTGQGRLVFDRRPEWEAALASFAGKVDRQGKPLRVTLSLERERKDRTLKQNRYFWGVIEPYCREYMSSGRALPLSREQCFTILKSVFLVPFLTPEELERFGCTPVAAQLPGGVEVQPEVSSTALSTVQWEEWSARIRDHAAHVWRLRIPEPNEPEEVAV